jgi:hypothetical protein
MIGSAFISKERLDKKVYLRMTEQNSDYTTTIYITYFENTPLTSLNDHR